MCDYTDDNFYSIAYEVRFWAFSSKKVQFYYKLLGLKNHHPRLTGFNWSKQTGWFLYVCNFGLYIYIHTYIHICIYVVFKYRVLIAIYYSHLFLYIKFSLRVHNNLLLHIYQCIFIHMHIYIVYIYSIYIYSICICFLSWNIRYNN